jgi:capsular polysaccharide biosynthesis protein
MEGDLCHDIHGDKPFGSYLLQDVALKGPAALISLASGPLVLEQNAGLLEHDDLLDVIVSHREEPSSAHPVEHQEALSLVSTCSSCFWHWMMDSLPKVLIAEESGFTGTYIIPSGDMLPTYVESMSLLGVSKERCQPYTDEGCIAQRLWVPTYFSGFNAPYNARFIRRYRERVLATVAPQVDSSQRLYVARKPNAKYRRVVNHSDVERVLQQFGFSTTYFEDLNVREQIALASRASGFVAPHGSGVTHSLFMKEGSFLLEFFPSQRRASCDCYEQLANVLNHSYASLESVRDSGDDIEVDLKRLENSLKSNLT